MVDMGEDEAGGEGVRLEEEEVEDSFIFLLLHHSALLLLCRTAAHFPAISSFLGLLRFFLMP